MRKGLSFFNIVSLVLGFAFLYVPIALLVIYSFNGSRLVAVWGGFSTRWYRSLLDNQQLLDAAWADVPDGATIAIQSDLNSAPERIRSLNQWQVLSQPGAKLDLFKFAATTPATYQMLSYSPRLLGRNLFMTIG